MERLHLNLISTLISPTDGFIEINNDNNKNLLLNLKEYWICFSICIFSR